MPIQMPGEGATGGDSMALLEARAQLVVEEKKASATGMCTLFMIFSLIVDLLHKNVK